MAEVVYERWQRVFGGKSVALVHSFPPGMEFGIDCTVYESGPRFHGVAMIPNGVHFVYYGHMNLPRLGFFFHSGVAPVLFNQWSSETEELISIKRVSESFLYSKMEEILRGDENEQLGPYSEQHYSIWENISHFITKAVLNRANCSLHETIYPGDDEDETEADRELTRVLSTNKRTSVLSNLSSTERTARFCDIRRIEADLIQTAYKSSDFGRKITQMKLDKSALVEELLSRYFEDDWQSLLGELQLSFVLFMMIHSYHCLNQWKLIVCNLCQAESYLLTNQIFAAAFIKVLFNQLKFVPDDFFENEMSRSNFILPALTSLFSSLPDAKCSADLLEHRRRLERYIAKKFDITVVTTAIIASPGENSVQDSYCVLKDDDNMLTREDDEESSAIIADSLSQPLEENTSQKQVESAFLFADFNKTMTATEKETMKYSWRYPLLFDAMKDTNGTEDITMTAMRLIDEIDDLVCLHQQSLSAQQELLRQEAIKFVENEVPLMS